MTPVGSFFFSAHGHFPRCSPAFRSEFMVHDPVMNELSLDHGRPSYSGVAPVSKTRQFSLSGQRILQKSSGSLPFMNTYHCPEVLASP